MTDRRAKIKANAVPITTMPPWLVDVMTVNGADWPGRSVGSGRLAESLMMIAVPSH
jgi:hypothetical protein